MGFRNEICRDRRLITSSVVACVPDQNYHHAGNVNVTNDEIVQCYDIMSRIEAFHISIEDPSLITTRENAEDEGTQPCIPARCRIPYRY